MESPFKNDPFALVWAAFKRLYPDKDCMCAWEPKALKDEYGRDVYGMTTFASDGRVVIAVPAGLSVNQAVEILAHELAHVAVGHGEGHGKEWSAAFDAIFDEYFKVAKELLPDMVFDEEDKR